MGRNQNNSAVIETLEGRMMMSASVAVHAAVKTVKAPAHTTVKLVDPVTTDKSITYQNYSADPLFSSAGPSIDDVSQGELGDCFLLATLSSIAKTDASLIRHDVIENTDGTYSVTFGHSAAIKVNADLPTLPDGQLAYAQFGAQNSIWVAVVEKAYAEFENPKTNSYNTINGGWMGEVFTAFGMNSKSTFSANTAAALMTMLAADLKANDFTTFATDAVLPKESPLIAGHAYEVDSVNKDIHGNVTSVTLRNPWGSDIADDGYITGTASQAFIAFAGTCVAHA